MRLTTLASGSAGNCAVVQFFNTNIMIDCGLSATAIERGLATAGINPFSINAIILTHEHGDHARGVDVWRKRWRTPVFASLGTAREVHGPFTIVRSGQCFAVKEAIIEPVAVAHNAQEPLGFVLHHGAEILGWFTDLGVITKMITGAIAPCNALFIESNYDQTMLENDESRPWQVKKRSLRMNGHLENGTTARTILEARRAGRLQNVVLGHISASCNTPELASKTVEHVAGFKPYVAPSNTVRNFDL